MSTEAAPGAPVTIYTIGHSTRDVSELIQALQSFGVRTVIDVRTVPGSRRYPQFNQEALAKLEREGRAGPVSLLCAEAVPWRCHRSLIADALLVRGHTVMHIMGPDAANPHKLTPWARVEGLQVTYPPEKGSPQAPQDRR